MEFDESYFEEHSNKSQAESQEIQSYSPLRLDLPKSTDYEIVAIGPKGGVSFNASEVIRYLRSQYIIFDRGIPRQFDGRIYRQIMIQDVRDLIYDAAEDSNISYSPTDPEVNNIISAAKSNLRVQRVFRGFYSMNQEEEYETGEDGRLIAFENGIYNTSTGTLLPFTTCVYLTFYYHVRYDPTIHRCEAQRILNGIIPNGETQDFFYEMCGYLFFETKMFPPALFNIYGPGKCGKSTLAKYIESIVGKENRSKIGISQLTRQFTTAELEGKQINICGETGGGSSKDTKIDGELLKLLTDGDEVLVEKKHKDPYYMVNTAKFLFLTNAIPDFGDNSSGLYRRLYVIACRIEQTEPDLDKILTQDDCKSWLLNKSLAAYKRFLKAGKTFTISPQMKLELTQYMSQDSVLDFLNATFGTLNRYELAEKIANHEEYCYTVELYETYMNYTRLALSQPLSRKKFVERIRNEYNLKTKTVSFTVGERTTTRTKYVL